MKEIKETHELMKIGNQGLQLKLERKRGEETKTKNLKNKKIM